MGRNIRKDFGYPGRSKDEESTSDPFEEQTVYLINTTNRSYTMNDIQRLKELSEQSKQSKKKL